MIYELFLNCNNREEFCDKLEYIYGLPSNSTLTKDIYDALIKVAMGSK